MGWLPGPLSKTSLPAYHLFTMPGNNWARRQPYRRPASPTPTPPPYDEPRDSQRARASSGDVATAELFRVREDIGVMRGQLNSYKDALEAAQKSLTDLEDQLRPIADGWNTTATLSEVNTVRDSVDGISSELADALERIRTLEDNLRSVTSNHSSLENRYTASGLSFRNLADRVEALERGRPRHSLVDRISGQHGLAHHRGRQD